MQYSATNSYQYAQVLFFTEYKPMKKRLQSLTFRKKIFTNILDKTYHGEVDIAGIELHVDLLVDEGLRLLVIVHADLA
jgi:hypothetical protein